MGYTKQTAIIFDSSPAGEHDKYLEMIVEDGRRVSARIRKARHTKSKWGASAEPVSVVSVQLYEKQSRLTVTGMSAVETFEGIDKTYERLLASAYIAEVIRGTTPYGVPESDTFEITVDTYRSLARSEDVKLTVNTFLSTIIQSAGYAIELDYCCECGREMTGDRRFSVDEVSVVCPDCRSYGTVRIPGFAVTAIRRLCDGDSVAPGEMDAKLSAGIHMFFERIIEGKFNCRPRSSLRLRGL